MQRGLSLPSSIFFSTMPLLTSAKCFLPPNLWAALFDWWFVTQQNRSGLHNVPESPPQCENTQLPPRTGLCAQGRRRGMEIHLGAQAGRMMHLDQGSAIRDVGVTLHLVHDAGSGRKNRPFWAAFNATLSLTYSSVRHRFSQMWLQIALGQLSAPDVQTRFLSLVPVLRCLFLLVSWVFIISCSLLLVVSRLEGFQLWWSLLHAPNWKALWEYTSLTDIHR